MVRPERAEPRSVVCVSVYGSRPSARISNKMNVWVCLFDFAQKSNGETNGGACNASKETEQRERDCNQEMKQRGGDNGHTNGRKICIPKRKTAPQNESFQALRMSKPSKI
jgi:hypothetical protein